MLEDLVRTFLQQHYSVEAWRGMDIKIVNVEKPETSNVILGQSHFIKTVEDLHEAMVNSVPGVKFGLAFCEGSEPALVRASGTDDDLIDLARKNAYAIGAGHCFLIIMQDAYPINVLGAIKRVPEVCMIFAATANPLQVLVVDTDQGRGIVGVVDGIRSKGIEGPDDVTKRKDILRKFGYKA